MRIHEFLFHLLIFVMLWLCVLNNDHYEVFDCNSGINLDNSSDWKLQLQNDTELIVRNCPKTAPRMFEQCFDYCFDHFNQSNICRSELTHVPIEVSVSMKNIFIVIFCHNNWSSNAELDLPTDHCIGKLNYSNNKLNHTPSLIQGCFYELSLKQNVLTNVEPELICQDCMHLVKLTLSYNNIQKIEGNTFDVAQNLKELILDHNTLSYLAANTFQKLEKLEILDLSHNSLKCITNELFHSLKKLKVLNLQNNSLSQLGTEWYKTMHKLQYVDLSENCIGFPYYDYHKKAPTDFHANILWLSHLTDKAAERKHPILRVNLSRNAIQEINLFHFRDYFWKYPDSNDSIEIDLSNNPINCECYAFELIRYSQNKSLYALNIKTDNLVCFGPPQYKNISLKYLDIYNISCDSTNSTTCPAKCTCLLKIGIRIEVIDCQQKNIKYIDVIKLRMNFGIELHLANNLISNIDEFLITNKLANITTLSLSHNNLSSVPEHLDLLKNLEVLRLDGNRIENLGRKFSMLFHLFPNIRAIALGNNPWICNCSIRGVAYILKEHKNEVIDSENMKCADSNKSIITLSLDEICSKEEKQSFQIEIIFAAVLFIISLVLIIVSYCKKERRNDIRVILSFTHTNPHGTELLPKKFDAFISYSHLDEYFVEQQLVPYLEREPRPFKICIHHRNFIPGKFITDEIVKSVEESRKTIIVLSNNYLASSWSTFEFQTAFIKMILQQNHELIVIMFKEIDLSSSKISPALNTYLQTRTYLKLEDPNFWSKLQTALES